MMFCRLSIVLLAAGIYSGCSMCQDKWDYAAPTKGSQPIPYSETRTRAGSVLSAGGAGTQTGPSDAPQMPAAPEESPASPELDSAPADSVTLEPTDTPSKYR